MVTRRGVRPAMRRVVGAAGLVLSLVLLAGGPAEADFGGNPPAPTPAPSAPVTPSGPSSATGSNSATNSGGCHFAAGPGGFGQHCLVSVVGGHVLTVAELLNGEELPTCWYEPLSPADLAAAHLLNTDAYTYYWYKCLSGIGPKPAYTIGPDGVKIAPQLRALPKGSNPPPLGVGQQNLVNHYGEAAGEYPPVVAIASGSGVVRVNEWVAYHGVPGQSQVLNVLGAAMQARVTHLSIKPLGAGQADQVDCDGTGQIVGATATPTSTAPGAACWYHFTKSSAGQTNEAFQMAVTATWSVRWTFAPGSDWNTWNRLANDIQVTTITQQKVTEIQTLVVN